MSFDANKLGLLSMRIPAYELPQAQKTSQPIKLLQFGGPSKLLKPIHQKHTQPAAIRSQIQEVKRNQHTDETGCQTNLEDDLISYQYQKDIGINADELQDMQFLEVNDIEDIPLQTPAVNYSEGRILMPVPTQQFEASVDIDEKQFTELPPRPISPSVLRDIEESAKLIREEEERLEMLRKDPMYHIKQTKEYRLKVLTEQLANLEDVACKLEYDMKNENERIEDIDLNYRKELEAEKKKVALSIVEKMERRIEDLQDYDNEEARIARVLAANKQLYGEIDSALKKKEKGEHEEVKIEQEQPIVIGPSVKARPAKFNAREYRKNTRGIITKRLNSAMGTAQQVIQMSKKQVRPAIVSMKY
ncbi:unnamed protein product [Blepharisma stoltei]|uniref:Uncharacterized protein n=1 Tax=Blepharisma stoltei TaxID=1481888 RepID=A0AAU9JJ27_9CILI|nr:unnamed protein product [Blepharisma stoltei]